MAQATHKTQSGRQPGALWGLLALASITLTLFVVALLVIFESGREQPVLASTATPEGVVQRYYAAAYRGDYAAAYAMLSESARRERSLSEFQSIMRYQRASEMQIANVAIHGDTATVTVTLTYFSGDGLFGGSQWSNQTDLLLERDGETWRITGEPF